MNKCFFIFCFLLLWICSSTFAQTTIIKGRVIAEGKPIAGASVTVQDSVGGTITNDDGTFSLNASISATLEVSMVGYNPIKVPVDNRTFIEIVLTPQTGQLDNIVVIGYQSATRRSVTTAIASLTSENIAPTVSANVGEALQGKVAGLQVIQGGGAPGSQPKLLVRGFTTITGASDPLIVVDGIVTSFGGLNDINPADIERVDVLKDAAATAIYGSRGGAGVLLVTTKRGTGKPKFNLRANVGTDYLVKPNLANTDEYVAHYREVFTRAGQELPAEASVSTVDTDWWEAVIDNGITHDYTLSASGGNPDGLQFYGSLGYYDRSNYFRPVNNDGHYRKVTGRFNIDYRVSPVVKFGVNLAPRYEGYGDGSVGLNSVMGIAPNVEIFRPLELTQAAVGEFATSNPTWNYTAYNPVYSQFYRSEFQNQGNPVASLYRQFGKTIFYGTQAAAYFELQPITDLTFKTTVSGFLNNTNTTNYDPKYFVNANEFNVNTGVSSNNVTTYRWQIDNSLNYKRSFGEHNLDVLAGQSADAYTYRNTYAYRQNIPFDDPAFRTVNAGTLVVEATGANQPGAAPFGKMTSYFGRLQYNFGQKYFAAASFRADGSSLLPPSNKWGYFPTASVAWAASEENFIKDNIKFIDFLKIRASYGQVGGNLPGSVGAYLYRLSDVDYVQGDRTRLVGYLPSNVPDPNIRWETTEDFTIGLDAALFRHKVNIALDKYWRYPKNMLLNLPILPSLGYPQGYIPTVLTNVGSMETKGWEASLGYNTNITQKLKFTGLLTIQRFESRAKDLRGQIIYDEISNDAFQSTRRTRTATGDILGSFYGFEVLGIFQTDEEVAAYKSSGGDLLQPSAKPGDFKYADINDDGLVNLDDRTFLGSPFPDLSTGLTLQLNYNGFDIRTEWWSVIGNKIANDGLIRLDPRLRQNFLSGETEKFWTGPGSTNEYPELKLIDLNGNFTRNSSFFIQDGSYVRLKLLQIGYTLPHKWVGRMAQSVRLYVNAQNLITITGYKGLNPEVPFSGADGLAANNSALRYGIDNGQNPIPKFFNVGLNLTF